MKSNNRILLTIFSPVLALLLMSSIAQAETCHRTKSEIDRDREFNRLLDGKSLFGTWRGPLGSSIDVRTDGKTTLNHPLKGRINLAISLCREQQEVYLRMNGKKIAFNDSNLNSIHVSDPKDPNRARHLFRHVR